MASHNLVGAYDSEEEALALVRDAVATNGHAVAEQLALIREDERGASEALAQGRALVRLAGASGGEAPSPQRQPLHR